MAEYIERDAAIAYIREQSEECQKAFEELGGESGIYADAYNDLAEDFYRIPAADVAPVVHGRWEVADWVELDDSGAEFIRTPKAALRCPHCKIAFKKELLWRDKYCPNCGARMDGEVNVD